MRKKRGLQIISMALSAGMLLMSGCSSEGTGASDGEQTETKQQTQEVQQNSTLDPVSLTFWIPGDSYEGQKEVMKTFCEKYKDELNIESITFNTIGFGDYSEKLVSLAASGDDFDACFIADWTGFGQMAKNKALLPLQDLMPEYAPGLYEEYKELDIIEASSVEGDWVALPWTREKNGKRGIYWRQDLADQYGVDTSNIETMEDLDRMLKEAHEKIPNLLTFNIGNNASEILNLTKNQYEMESVTGSLMYNLHDENATLIPLEQTQAFSDAVMWAKKWYDEGIIDKNALSSTDTTLYFENGQCFAGVATMEKIYNGVNFNVSGAECGYAELYPDKWVSNDSPLNNAIAINQNARNPERVLMLLELLNSNEEAYDLFMYGVEGKDYVLNDGLIQYPEGQDSTNSTYMGWFYWGFLREKFDLPSETNSPEYQKKYGEWLAQDNKVVGKLTGFNPGVDEIKTELAQRDQLYSEQGVLLLAGIVDGDVDQAVNAYIENQKKAGLDTIVSYIQEKANTFIAE